jgi:transposase
MTEVTTIGVDLAKDVFQVHGVNDAGGVVVRRQLRRGQVLTFFKKQRPCLVGMEACATSHHWAREIICEAVTRPTMRFVAIKSPDQQSVLMLHRTRHLFVRQRTTLINALRAHLAEFGIVAGVGRNGLEKLLQVVEGGDERVPSVARDCLLALRDQLVMVKQQIVEMDRRVLAWHRASEVSQRLDDIPGVGPLIATALVASVPDPHAFKSGRDLAAWIGLVPRQNSTGGKERLGRISKAGNRYLRMLLVAGALSVIRRAKQVGYTRHPWLTRLLQRRSTKIAAIALANKIARTAWAMMTHGTFYQEPAAQAV